VVDRRGVPLAAVLSAANTQDCLLLDAVLDAVPAIRHGVGRPRRRPAKLHADKGYDHRRCRRACRQRNIASRIARRGIESSARLGRHRWAGALWAHQRTLAWLSQFRRLTIRYDRRLDIHQAFVTLACDLICWNFVQRFC
jgi:IS5 family transposase